MSHTSPVLAADSMAFSIVSCCETKAALARLVTTQRPRLVIFMVSLRFGAGDHTGVVVVVLDLLGRLLALGLGHRAGYGLLDDLANEVALLVLVFAGGDCLFLAGVDLGLELDLLAFELALLFHLLLHGFGLRGLLLRQHLV